MTRQRPQESERLILDWAAQHHGERCELDQPLALMRPVDRDIARRDGVRVDTRQLERSDARVGVQKRAFAWCEGAVGCERGTQDTKYGRQSVCGENVDVHIDPVAW